jgi:hypothetical protein
MSEIEYKVMIPAKNKYVYKYTPAKKLDDKRTAMAGVEVYDIEGVKIGGQCFTKSPKDAFSKEVKDMVNYIIYDHEDYLYRGGK